MPTFKIGDGIRLVDASDCPERYKKWQGQVFTITDLETHFGVVDDCEWPLVCSLTPLGDLAEIKFRFKECEVVGVNKIPRNL